MVNNWSRNTRGKKSSIYLCEFRNKTTTFLIPLCFSETPLLANSDSGRSLSSSSRFNSNFFSKFFVPPPSIHSLTVGNRRRHLFFFPIRGVGGRKILPVLLFCIYIHSYPFLHKCRGYYTHSLCSRHTCIFILFFEGYLFFSSLSGPPHF